MSKLGLLFATTLLLALPAAAQPALTLPEESQRATVSQRIGITDLTVSYHRPLKKGRPLWGKLVPYGQVWRAGANENTTFTTTHPVQVEGKALPQGTYGLHMIPGEKEWTVIFSKMFTAWGSYTYSEAEDALRVKVAPRAAEAHEALTFTFDNPTAENVLLTLSWDKLSVAVKVAVNVDETSVASIHDQMRGGAQWNWQAWDEAATFLLDHKLNPAEALADCDRSIEVEERFENTMTKVRALEALGRKDEAMAMRAKAMGVGNPEQLHTYGRTLLAQGKTDLALDVFRANMKKAPAHWLAHNDAARIACAQGDFAGAANEMKLALAAAPPASKQAVEGLIKKLESKEDINK